jgi:predicted nucleic acid-binding protein
MSSPKSPYAVVIDANVAVKAILPLGSGAELDLIRRWSQEETPVFAPDLWVPESISTIRRLIVLKALTGEEGRQAVEDLFKLGVQVIASDIRLCEAALEWSEKLGQSKAYDGFYLALTERISMEHNQRGEFWTSDERLYNRAHQVGGNWVRSMQENSTPG